MELVCRYLVEEQRLGELDIKWYLDSSPSPWLVHLPHHWTLPHIVRGSRLADHVSQVIDWHYRDSVAATPAFLCHKVTAQGFQSHLLGVYFAARCVFMKKGGFHAQKNLSLDAIMPKSHRERQEFPLVGGFRCLSCFFMATSDLE